MVIVETSIFTRQVVQLLSDESYRSLQELLVRSPDIGDIIPGSGGLRKMRWGLPGKGKRGGSRIIYYWAVKPERLLMLFIYPKSDRDDLSFDQIKVLRRIVREEYP